MGHPPRLTACLQTTRLIIQHSEQTDPRQFFLPRVAQTSACMSATLNTATRLPFHGWGGGQWEARMPALSRRNAWS